MTPEAIAELKKPLDKRHVASRQQSGRSLSYIEGWHAIAEANRIFGHDAWTSETVDIRCVAERERGIGRDQKPGWGVSYIARVKITVGSSDNPFGGVVREGVGSGHGIDVDLGLAHESAIKEAETDARKRALMTFGWPFGLALYDKSQENVVSEPPGNPAGRGAGAVSPSAVSAPTNSDDPADLYVKAAKAAMKTAKDAPELKRWWADEERARIDFGITKGTKRYDALWEAFLDIGGQMATKPKRELHPLEAG